STPAVRRLAEEHGVDLRQVTGTGLGGRVTKEDILQYVAQRGTAPAPAAPTAPGGPAPTPSLPVPPTPAPAPQAAPVPVQAPALPSTAMGDVAMGLTPMRR